MADVFISYSRCDALLATSLAEQLRASGASVWLDTASLTAAETWSAEIVGAIKACETFILLLSPSSVASRNVIKEVSLASEKEKRIIPIELEVCELGDAMEYALAGVQRVSIADAIALERAFAKIGIANVGVTAVAQAQPVQMPESTQIRIAIIPFEDQSPAHDNEWFADGLTDELISTLNKLDAIVVLDRPSSKNYKGTTLTSKQIAAELGVRYLISGAVRKAGEKLRINATLVDVALGTSIWDDKFSGTIDDIFEIQEKTALDICAGLKLKLTPEEELLLEEKLTNSPEAYEIYLRAYELCVASRFRPEAIELLHAAIRIDPNFIPAHYLLSMTYANIYLDSGETDRTMLEHCKAAFTAITEIDPKSYFSYGPRANYYLYIGENELALEMALKAVEMQPKRRSSYSVLAFIYQRLGKRKECIEAFKKASALDPMFLVFYPAILQHAYFTGDTDTTREWWPKTNAAYQLALAKQPNQLELLLGYQNAAQFGGDAQTAVRIAERLLALPEFPEVALYDIAGSFAMAGQIERSAESLRTLIEKGFTDFDDNDSIWFGALKGTPEYDYILRVIDQRHSYG